MLKKEGARYKFYKNPIHEIAQFVFTFFGGLFESIPVKKGHASFTL